MKASVLQCQLPARATAVSVVLRAPRTLRRRGGAIARCQAGKKGGSSNKERASGEQQQQQQQNEAMHGAAHTGGNHQQQQQQPQKEFMQDVAHIVQEQTGAGPEEEARAAATMTPPGPGPGALVQDKNLQMKESTPEGAEHLRKAAMHAAADTADANQTGDAVHDENGPQSPRGKTEHDTEALDDIGPEEG